MHLALAFETARPFLQSKKVGDLARSFYGNYSLQTIIQAAMAVRKACNRMDEEGLLPAEVREGATGRVKRGCCQQICPHLIAGAKCE